MKDRKHPSLKRDPIDWEKIKDDPFISTYHNIKAEIREKAGMERVDYNSVLVYYVYTRLGIQTVRGIQQVIGINIFSVVSQMVKLGLMNPDTGRNLLVGSKERKSTWEEKTTPLPKKEEKELSDEDKLLSIAIDM